MGEPCVTLLRVTQDLPRLCILSAISATHLLEEPSLNAKTVGYPSYKSLTA